MILRKRYLSSSVWVTAIVLCALLGLSGCVYSFTGASVPSHLKTVAIPLVDDQSGFGEPGLREEFTTELITLFIADNSLEVADRVSADAILEGVIVRVSDDPVVVEKGEQVSRRRVTLSVKYVFHDMKLKKKVWEKTFSHWGDFESGGGISQRPIGMREAMKKVTEDILLQTVSGW